MNPDMGERKKKIPQPRTTRPVVCLYWEKGVYEGGCVAGGIEELILSTGRVCILTFLWVTPPIKNVRLSYSGSSV